ncbi:MAG: AAA family ATPase [Syntrophomonadaceae bacterium]|jgi:replicative DNA helicase|nr:AAA family ATPase [Syntrophomonadaceae bacterium]
MAIQHSIAEEKLCDLESERRVLSAMLNSEEACIEAYDSLQAQDFYSIKHQHLFQLICGLYERDIRPTYIELLKEAHQLQLFNEPREIEEIQYIAEHFIDDGNIRYWIERVKDKARLRIFENFLRSSYRKLMEKDLDDVEQVLLEAQDELTNMTALEIDDRVDSPADLAQLGYDEVERRFLRFKEIQEKHKGVLPLDGLTTGFDTLNHITLGYKPGDLIIVGAQTGHGKTALALHTAQAVAVEHQHNVLYLNTEMSRVQIALRWGSILSGIEHNLIRRGELSETELSQVLEAYSRLRNSGFYSYPCPNLTPEKTISIARKFKVQHDVKLMVLDYVGRMDKINPNLAEWQVLEQIVKTQKMLAQNLNIAVMCLVQLNEDGSLQGARRMKNECDLMLKLIPISEEEIQENPELKKYKDPNYYLYIDKNRDGIAGVYLPICFDKTRQSMKDAERIAL